METSFAKIINFNELIGKSTKEFVGRQWVRNAIDKFLNASGPPCFLLLGGPGSGKTACMADLVRRRGYAHHFIGKGSQISLVTSLDWRNPTRFAESIGYQLVRDYGGWIMNWEQWGIDVDQRVKQLDGLLAGSQIEDLKAMPRPIDRPTLTIAQEVEQFGPTAQMIGVYIERFIVDVEQIFHQLLIVPLQSISERWPEHQVVIVVDGLDEAEDYSNPQHNILKLLSSISLPVNTRFLLSSRPGDHLTSGFLVQTQSFWLSEDEHGEKNPHVLDDSDIYLRKIAQEDQIGQMLARQDIKPDNFCEQVTLASQGNFLYLHHYAQGLRNGDETLLNLSSLPRGLHGIYDDFLHKIKDKREDLSWDNGYKPIMGILAVARAPLTRKQIVNFSGLKPRTVGTILTRLKQFLDITIDTTGRQHYAMYHLSFGEYLISEENEDCIDGLEAHSQIVQYYYKAYSADWSSCDDRYGLQNLTIHLAQADDFESLYRLVEHWGWYTARSKDDFSRRGYADDLDLAFNKAAMKGTIGWPHLAVNALLRATLAGVAKSLPVEIYETLVRLGRGREALQRARLISDDAQKSQVLKTIEITLQKLNETDLLHQVRQDLSGLPSYEPRAQDNEIEEWLVSLVARFGAERALQEALRMGVISEADRARDVKKHIQVARAALKNDQVDAARDLLLRCLDFVPETWDWDRQSYLLQIARLLLRMGYESDLYRLLDLASNIELELNRVFTLAELALICTDARNDELQKRVLETAINQVEIIGSKATFQAELSKIALTMSRLNDSRAEKFLQTAIKLAEKPVQPAHRWEEEEAWTNLATAMVSAGLADEGLSLFRELSSDRSLSADRFVAEFAFQKRWTDALRVVDDLRPIAKKRALFQTGYKLAQAQQLTDNQYQLIISNIESLLQQESQPHDRAKTLEGLISLAIMMEDEASANKYLLQITDLLNHIPDRGAVDLTIKTLHTAVKLANTQILDQLSHRAERLPEDSYYGHSTTMAVVCRAFADLNQINKAWSLAQNIKLDSKRLEARLRICQSLHQQDREFGQYLTETLVFARQVENVGYVPSLWGELAELSYALGNNVEEPIEQAIEGACTIVPTHHFDFNIQNIANVAKSLQKVGLTTQAHELVKNGLVYLEQTEVMIEFLRPLVQAVVKIRAKELWPEVLRVAHLIKQPSSKAEALLGITYAMARSEEINQAITNLSDVLAAIHNTERYEAIIIEFGEMLVELDVDANRILNNLISRAFQHARLKDRSTVITWTAAFLPVFAKVDLTLASTTWQKIKNVELMLKQ